MRRFSSGEQTRVGLAKAMLNNPRLLLLDGAYRIARSGDRKRYRLKIREYVSKSGAGVLWTSHQYV